MDLSKLIEKAFQSLCVFAKLLLSTDRLNENCPNIDTYKSHPVKYVYQAESHNHAEERDF